MASFIPGLHTVCSPRIPNFFAGPQYVDFEPNNILKVFLNSSDFEH